MPNRLAPTFSWIGLGAVALMAIAPFLIAHHYNPIPTFFQEWTAVALGLAALTALLPGCHKTPLEIPEIALLPVGLLLIAALQGLFLADVLPERLLMFCAYMTWSFLLIILGRHLVRRWGLETIAGIIATALLVGALLEAFTAALQWVGMARLPWVFPAKGSGLRSNLGQPNNFADYLWLGVASAIYLRERGELGSIAATAALLALLPFAVLSGSRSVWLYAGGIAFLSCAWTWRRGWWPPIRLRVWSLGALAGSILFQLALDRGTAALPRAVATSGSRLASHGAHDPARLTLWRSAIDTFLENPWLGAGVGQYPRQFHLHVLDLLPLRLPGLPEHAHNVLLHLLAEMGLAAGLLLAILGLRWIYRLAQASRSPEIWWIGACVLVLGIHSNLEYPLWYAFFLGIAAILAGAGSRTNHPLRLGAATPYLLSAFLAFGSAVLFNLYRGYSLLETTLNGPAAEDYRQRADKVLRQLADDPLLRPYVDLNLAHLMTESSEALDTKLHNCDRAQRFSASRDIVFKCAYILKLGGKDEAAALALKRAVAAYPAQAKQVLQQWKTRSSQEPALVQLLATLPPTP